MKKQSILIVLSLLLWPALNSVLAQAQLAKVEGKITDNGRPVPDVFIVMTNNATGRIFKMKADANGDFFGVGFPVGEYKVQIFGPGGNVLFAIDKRAVTSEDGKAEVINIDLTKDRSSGSGQPAMSQEQIEAIKAQNAKAANLNALITQYTNAANAKDWADAITALKGMIQIDPNRWDFYQALGNAQGNAGAYQEAVDAFEKGLAAAKEASNDPKADQAKIKAATARMLSTEGSAYLKLRKTNEAIESFSKAAAIDPTAYFNLCATQYNAGNVEGAKFACDKAIQADPNRADLYFIKGSLMVGDSTTDKDGKLRPPPGTAEVLNKYLELAPNGSHADDVKAMLTVIGAR